MKQIWKKKSEQKTPKNRNFNKLENPKFSPQSYVIKRNSTTYVSKIDGLKPVYDKLWPENEISKRFPLGHELANFASISILEQLDRDCSIHWQDSRTLRLQFNKTKKYFQNAIKSIKLQVKKIQPEAKTTLNGIFLAIFVT